MKDQEKDNERAIEQARSQLEGIAEMVSAYENAENDKDRDEAEQRINEDPLEISVREPWHAPGKEAKPDEYLILLCTGGPAVRITGDLADYGEPETASIEYQDWFTQWERFDMTEEEKETVLKYARHFYFGE
jgi:hypothetical protein